MSLEVMFETITAMRPSRLFPEVNNGSLHRMLSWSNQHRLGLPNERVKETQGGPCFRVGQACVAALRSLPWCR
jgi:hypothetical protein